MDNMSKKKKKKKQKSISILNEVDKTMGKTYDNIIQEIEDMQLQLYIADQKARKKAKKKMRKDPNYFKNSEERMKARREVIETMEGKNFFDRIEKVLKDIAPIVVLISRLVASLILSILSLDVVKMNIKPETLGKMKNVYQLAVSVK